MVEVFELRSWTYLNAPSIGLKVTGEPRSLCRSLEGGALGGQEHWEGWEHWEGGSIGRSGKIEYLCKATQLVCVEYVEHH